MATGSRVVVESARLDRLAATGGCQDRAADRRPPPADVVACDSVSINLFKLMAAAVRHSVAHETRYEDASQSKRTTSLPISIWPTVSPDSW